MAERVKAIDWARHNHNIYFMAVQWFTVMSKELHNPVIVSGDVYNIEESGALSRLLICLKVVGREQYLMISRGARVKQTLVTATKPVFEATRIPTPIRSKTLL